MNMPIKKKCKKKNAVYGERKEEKVNGNRVRYWNLLVNTIKT